MNDEATVKLDVSVSRFHDALIRVHQILRPAILRLQRGRPKSIWPRGSAYRRRQIARRRR